MTMNAFNGDRLQADQDDGGIGVPSKHSLLMLKVITSDIGTKWLSYSGIRGADQDDSGFTLYYHGAILWESKVTLRWWKVVVAGKGLEAVARHVRAGVQPLLNVTAKDKVQITSITIEELEAEETF